MNFSTLKNALDKDSYSLIEKNDLLVYTKGTQDIILSESSDMVYILEETRGLVYNIDEVNYSDGKFSSIKNNNK